MGCSVQKQTENKHKQRNLEINLQRQIEESIQKQQQCNFLIIQKNDKKLQEEIKKNYQFMINHQRNKQKFQNQGNQFTILQFKEEEYKNMMTQQSEITILMIYYLYYHLLLQALSQQILIQCLLIKFQRLIDNNLMFQAQKVYLNYDSKLVHIDQKEQY
ncbi:unnamed protein product [Paramecium sonneborni]|uniref:Uncharacterized protein n=1 Tax=Paramecium sonneborni TaxID=65129 RepID=A0A8S1KD75_9CILI|nr:unnamed protein product [Paramecium sonneborni]